MTQRALAVPRPGDLRIVGSREQSRPVSERREDNGSGVSLEVPASVAEKLRSLPRGSANPRAPRLAEGAAYLAEQVLTRPELRQRIVVLYRDAREEIRHSDHRPYPRRGEGLVWEETYLQALQVFDQAVRPDWKTEFLPGHYVQAAGRARAAGDMESAGFLDDFAYALPQVRRIHERWAAHAMGAEREEALGLRAPEVLKVHASLERNVLAWLLRAPRDHRVHRMVRGLAWSSHVAAEVHHASDPEKHRWHDLTQIRSKFRCSMRCAPG